MTRNLIARAIAITVLTFAAWATTLPVSAQSLGEAAQKEAARRKATRGPVRVVTNENLKPQPPAAEPEPGAEAAQSAAPATGAAAETAAANEPAAPELVKDAGYWNQRITEARQRRDQNAFLIEAVQSRINALTTDFYARDDPFQRAKLGEERQRTLAELDRMKREQQALEKQISDIEEEARRENVPPGWLR